MLRKIVGNIRDRIQLSRNPVAYARRMGATVGRDCRLDLERHSLGSEPYLIEIGNHVTVTKGVRFVTHDGGVWVLRNKYPNIDIVGRITILDNVFIGLGATLLPGITVGPNAIIGAGSIVNRDVPSGTVVAGVPARHIKSLEEYEGQAVRRAIHVRHLPRADKRDAFLAHTAPKGSGPEADATRIERRS